MSYPRDLVVRKRAAERLAIYDLTYRPFDQVWTSQTHERRAFDHDDEIRERRQISPAGYAGPHHRRKLRHFQVAPHDRVVKEDSPAAVLSGEHAALIWEIHSRRVDQVDDRHAAPHRDLLRAKHLADGFRPPRACLHRRVVGDNHGFASSNAACSRDDSRCGRLSVVEIVGDQQTDLLKVRILIEQKLDSFAGGKLTFRVLASDPLGPAAQPETIFQRP